MAIGKLADLMAEDLASTPAVEPAPGPVPSSSVRRRSRPTAKEAQRTAKPPHPEKEVAAEPAPVEIERVTLYLPKPVYRYLKQLALDLDVSRTHDLLIEGVEMVLAKHGKSIAALTRNK